VKFRTANMGIDALKTLEERMSAEMIKNEKKDLENKND
ncbi:MAG: HPr kinase/phosphorylase, partial [Leuconostoc citreum]|nr:HPr kinase/phosphorylase [Leuconostoc citreum]